MISTENLPVLIMGILCIVVPLVIIILLIVFKKAFVIPLVAGVGLLAFGLHEFLNAQDHLKGFMNNVLNFAKGEYEKYLSQKNTGIILIVVGAIVTLIGIIFAIKSGNRNKKAAPAFAGDGYAAGTVPAMFCAGCGKPLSYGTTVCPACGTPVAPQTVRQTIPADAPSQPKETGEQNGQNAPISSNNVSSEKIVCPSCGKENEKDSRFCENCGTRLSN